MTSNRSPEPKPSASHPQLRPLAHGPPPDAAGVLVVGIGASAGGLDACMNLVGALRETGGMAFILVQHLDPGFPSMMAELLSEHTPMPVLQATDGMPIEPGHFYIIPPGAYLAAHAGLLHLSVPQARHGARLPFDFLLHSLAAAYGPNAVGIVLSGTGADGSLGLAALKAKGGFVIAQDPDEAGYDGMPRSAIEAGVVDLVLPVAEMPAALDGYARRSGRARQAAVAPEAPPSDDGDCLAAIIELLRAQTPHDFRLYKHGTLLRRIGRRMATAPIQPGNMPQYLALLHNDPAELDMLAKNLLINVTSFFRDPKVFDLLDSTIVPEMIRSHGPGEPLRIWVPACSTGEETYSLAMLFIDHLTAAKSRVKLQIFASDVDPSAIAAARDGHYPFAIEADVPAGRLARFFIKDENGYRVSPDLRGTVVFTVQDVLADPPFSRLDFISCRNLLIYLGPQAQAKVLALFHFALRPGGLLLLGGAETVGNVAGRFEVLAKAERLYRHIGRSRPGDLEFSMTTGDSARARARARPGLSDAQTRQTTLAELGRRMVLENYAPAAVLINGKHECLYSMGPIDRYLRLAPGLATHDLFAMTRDSMRMKLRAAIQQAGQQKARVMVPGGRTPADRGEVPFTIDVHPLLREDEELYLVCFVDEPRHTAPAGQTARTIAAHDMPRVAELEQELSDTRTELQGAIRSLELSSEEQKSINEEALSVNEEYQSTNEELLTSKEELQSLNEELTALNSQLQETLERQRRTSDDLQNVLYSTDVATLFLDVPLNIRFFTPATRALFNILPTDIGRPLSDLNSLAADSTLSADAQTVLETGLLQEREIETGTGTWFSRRILPYRTHDGGVEGVVITFTDVSERKRTAKALLDAKQEAEAATVAKSRFLAAASHDLRQPLQTVALIQGLLAKTVDGVRPQKLIARLDETLGAMTGMLNTLLDINQIEAGIVLADKRVFPVNDLLTRLGEEFGHLAQVQGLGFRTVPCSLSIDSDPILLEQILRNLLSNALKYTGEGKVLFGCRRRAGMLTIAIADTGVGIPQEQLQAVFEEYYQLDNATRERSHGLGLGLSIVQRLSDLLGHRVHVRSVQGRGSVFSVDVALGPDKSTSVPDAATRESSETPRPGEPEPPAPPRPRRTAGILVVEDDPELRELLELFLTGEGYRVALAVDGPTALELVRGTVRPDLLLADYNLPGGMNGLQLAARLRADVETDIPVIVLTGDISTKTLRDVAAQRCLKLNKPVKLTDLHQAIQGLLPEPQPPGHSAAPFPGMDGKVPPTVFIVDDDPHVRNALQAVLTEDGIVTHCFDTGEAFLAAYVPGRESCLLLDAGLPGMDGIAVLQRMYAMGFRPPTIMITGNADTTVAIAAMKAGALDFIQKPIGREDLLASVEHAFEMSRDSRKLVAWRKEAAAQVAGLTPRQHEIMTHVLAGHPSKIIAADLGISQRTVENHRAAIMEKTGASSVAALARMALAAVADPDA